MCVCWDDARLEKKTHTKQWFCSTSIVIIVINGSKIIRQIYYIACLVFTIQTLQYFWLRIAVIGSGLRMLDYVFLMTCKAMHLRVTFSTSAHVDPKRNRLLTLCALRHKLILYCRIYIPLHPCFCNYEMLKTYRLYRTDWVCSHYAGN